MHSFLKNRSNKLNINESNMNDVINIFGQPHSKSVNNNNQEHFIPIFDSLSDS